MGQMVMMRKAVLVMGLEWGGWPLLLNNRWEFGVSYVSPDSGSYVFCG